MNGNGFLHEDEGTTWEGSPEKFIRNDPSSPLHFRRKVPVSVLGATTEAGQHLVAQLINHPWFDLIGVSQIGETKERRYGEVVQWMLKSELPQRIAQLPLTTVDTIGTTALVFSALNVSKSKDIEQSFAKKGCAVLSRDEAQIQDKNIPLVVAEVNPDHLCLIKQQGFTKGGMIVVSPTVFATALSLILRPVQLEFGIIECQLVSGFQQQNLETEVKEILGTLNGSTVIPYTFLMNASTGVVAKDSLITVVLTVKEDTSLDKFKRAISEYSPLAEEMRLPTAPIFPINIMDDPGAPFRKRANLEPNNREEGMGVAIRGLQSLSSSKYALTILKTESNKFLAGRSVMNAELLVSAGYIYW